MQMWVVCDDFIQLACLRTKKEAHEEMPSPTLSSSTGEEKVPSRDSETEVEIY